MATSSSATGSADVDSYIAELTEPARSRMSEIRALVASSAPGATEVISYGIPAARYRKVIVYYGAWKNHCAMYGIPASVLDPFRAELGDRLGAKGTIKFPHKDPLPSELISKLVAAHAAVLSKQK